MLSLIVAHTPSFVIGRSDTNTMPWPKLRSDLRRFRELTLGKRLVLGRKTWESLPRRPLSGRQVIVLSRDLDYEPRDTDGLPCRDVRVGRWGDDQLSWAAEYEEEYIIAGGSEVYAMALPYATRVYRTIVRREFPEGDVYFPDELTGSEWLMEVEGRATDGGIGVEFQVLTRRS